MHASLGVLIGRFQTIDLHAGFRDFIESVLEKHTRTAVFIGSNPAALSQRDPLDFLSRKKMLEEYYPNQLIIKQLDDHSEDKVWSNRVDTLIDGLTDDFQNIVIYGDEQAVGQRYFGRFLVKNWTPKMWIKTPPPAEIIGSRDFRAGIFYAAFFRKYPLVFATVDIGIFRKNRTEILLGRKHGESAFRFPGGFSDPSDASFEAAVLREAREECGEIKLENLTYRGSKQIVEWRYGASEDAVITHFFTADFVIGEARAADDLAEICWVSKADFDPTFLVAEHRELWNFLENK
jgi:bifunctional NMN adenylyltransferase/nudix hydrolase